MHAKRWPWFTGISIAKLFIMSDGRTVCCRSRENGELYGNRTVFGWCYSVGANTKIDRDDKNGTAVIFVLLHVWELSLRSADDGFHFALFYTYSSPSDVKVMVKHAQPLTSMQIIVLHFFRRRLFFVPYHLRINSRYPRTHLLIVQCSGDARAGKIKTREFR